MKLGLMCRSDYSGLGNQTRRMAQLLKPDRILLIDSSGFSKNSVQHPDWYDGFSGYLIQSGFPSDREVRKGLQGLTHFICCENPMSINFYAIAREMGVKTYCVVNYEFLDTLNRPDMAEPDFFIMPSYWKIQEMKDKYGEDRVIYLPPPLFLNDFADARQTNFKRSGSERRFLHTVGTLAAHDRNGTLDLLESLKYTNAEFKLVIKSQQPLPSEYISADHRVSYRIGSCDDPQDIYKDFDALILPRRYGGLCLPVNEALASGLPVFMTDISPNNQLLPDRWLIPTKQQGQFLARVMITYYGVEHPERLATGIDSLCNMPNIVLDSEKLEAVDIAMDQFSASGLKERYEALWTL